MPAGCLSGGSLRPAMLRCAAVAWALAALLAAATAVGADSEWVPVGYHKAGHRDSGWSLPKEYVAGEQPHETVMFTREGSVYRKRLEDASHLPRSLSEISGTVGGGRRPLGTISNSSASLNPDLECRGCPETDVRMRITDTTATPWNAIGLLAQRLSSMNIVTGIAQCSGTLIGAARQHVLTAGHCLVDSSDGSDVIDKITFYPGLNTANDLPFGTLSAIKARVLRQYVEESAASPLGLNYDFALVTLERPAPVNTTFLNIAAGQGMKTFNLTTAGYPADKSDGLEMYAVNCTNVDFDFTDGANGVLGCGGECDNVVVHDCLSYEGQSGSAIWSREGDTRTVRAILTGALVQPGLTYNVGTQLNDFVYNTIASWYNEDISDGLVTNGSNATAPPLPSSASDGPPPSSSASDEPPSSSPSSASDEPSSSSSASVEPPSSSPASVEPPASSPASEPPASGRSPAPEPPPPDTAAPAPQSGCRTAQLATTITAAAAAAATSWVLAL